MPYIISNLFGILLICTALAWNGAHHFPSAYLFEPSAVRVMSSGSLLLTSADG